MKTREAQRPERVLKKKLFRRKKRSPRCRQALDPKKYPRVGVCLRYKNYINRDFKGYMGMLINDERFRINCLKFTRCSLAATTNRETLFIGRYTDSIYKTALVTFTHTYTHINTYINTHTFTGNSIKCVRNQTGRCISVCV